MEHLLAGSFRPWDLHMTRRDDVCSMILSVTPLYSPVYIYNVCTVMYNNINFDQPYKLRTKAHACRYTDIACELYYAIGRAIFYFLKPYQ